MIRTHISRIVFAWVAIIIIVALFGDVSIAATDAGRTSADFLLIGSGARAAGMAGAYSAVSEGAITAHWNPSGLANLEHTEVALGHFAWFQDITVEQAAVAFPVGDRLTMATSITFVNYGTIEGYDLSGAATGELSAYDLAGGVSLGYFVRDDLAIGVTAKYINQRLDVYTASAFALDLGLRYELPRVSLAAVLTNIGTKLKFDEQAENLPSAVKLGVAARPLDAGLVTSLELEKRIHGDFLIRQGFELGFDDKYFLRTGYDYLPSQNGRMLATGITMGAGVKLGFAEFDYAYTPNDKSTTEDLHRFSVVFPFNR